MRQPAIRPRDPDSSLFQGDTFVDFDQGLNTAINKLRETLGDSASIPRFIETVPKRGYRFTFPLETELTNQPTRDTPTRVSPAWRNRKLLLAIAVCLVIGGVAAVEILLLRKPVSDTQLPLRRFTFRPPAPINSLPFAFPVAISPDGRQIAFVAGEGAGKLWIHDLAKPPPRPMEGTEGALGPFWSPDSEFIGFATEFPANELKKLSLKGGSPTTLCKLSATGFFGATWSPDGQLIVFSDGSPSSLYQYL